MYKQLLISMGISQYFFMNGSGGHLNFFLIQGGPGQRGMEDFEDSGGDDLKGGLKNSWGGLEPPTSLFSLVISIYCTSSQLASILSPKESQLHCSLFKFYRTVILIFVLNLPSIHRIPALRGLSHSLLEFNGVHYNSPFK
jgi:hypothetical protein